VLRDDRVHLFYELLAAVLGHGAVVEGERRALALGPGAVDRTLLEVFGQRPCALAVVDEVLVDEVGDVWPRDLEAVIPGEDQGRLVHHGAHVLEGPTAHDRDVGVVARGAGLEGLAHGL